MRAWLREPLLHFLLAGAAIFLLYRVLNGEQQGPREIVVSEAQVEALAQSHARIWLRPPTAAELRGLVDDYIKEEVLYREALALGIDKDDTVIRRRLRQKMEFVSADAAAARPPTDAELEAWLAAHAADYAEPPRFSFQQVYFSTDRRGEAAVAEAKRLQARLDAAGATAAVPAGDPTLLPGEMRSATSRDIANAFGEAFAAELEQAALGRWIGPVESPFGAHVVRITAQIPGRTPVLADVHAAVVRDWQADRQTKADEAFYKALLEKYDVRIEGKIGELLRRQADAGPHAAAADGRS